MYEHECSGRCRGRQGCRWDPASLEAKALCAICPVLLHCRIWALETEYAFGVTGGFTEAERSRLQKANRRST